MTYTESAKELNRIAQKIYNCDNTINLRDKLVFEIMQCAEELKQFIPDASNYTLVKEVKRILMEITKVFILNRLFTGIKHIKRFMKSDL